MSAAAKLYVSVPPQSSSADSSGVYPLGSSMRPPTPEEIAAWNRAEVARQGRRRVATVMVFVLLASLTGLSVFALGNVIAKIVAGAIGGVMLGAVAVTPSGRIDPKPG